MPYMWLITATNVNWRGRSVYSRRASRAHEWHENPENTKVERHTHREMRIERKAKKNHNQRPDSNTAKEARQQTENIQTHTHSLTHTESAPCSKKPNEPNEPRIGMQSNNFSTNSAPRKIQTNQQQRQQQLELLVFWLETNLNYKAGLTGLDWSFNAVL